MLINQDKKIRAGVYVGSGPKPDNVETDMYIDMNGKNVGIYIAGIGRSDDKIPDLFEKAIKENPSVAQELSLLLSQYKKSNSDFQRKNIFLKTLDFGKNNVGVLIGAANLLLNTAKMWLDIHK